MLAQRGVKLIKGDGHIVLADCGSNPNNPPDDLILVQSNDLTLPGGINFCFKASGASGLLTMEIPKVYFVRSDVTRTLAAKVEVKDDPAVVEVEEVLPEEWQPVGVGQDPAKPRSSNCVTPSPPKGLPRRLRGRAPARSWWTTTSPLGSRTI